MDFQKRKYYHHNVCNYSFFFFLYKGTKQVDTNYNVPIVSKLTFTCTEKFLTYLNFVRFCLMQWGYAVHNCFRHFGQIEVALSQTPVSLLTRTYLFPLNFHFDGNFFVLGNFKQKLNTCHTHRPTPARNKTPELDTTIDTCCRMWNIAGQHFSPHRRNKYPANPKTLGISAFYSAGVQKVHEKFKGRSLN
jgi:hypothetical protein